MKRIVILAIAVLALALSMSFAFAAEPGAAVNGTVTDEGVYLLENPDSINVTDGHIYSVDLDTNMSTMKWAGITGNVTGNIVLGDDDEEVLYTWTAAGLLVYASEDAAPTWASLADANAAAVEGVYSHVNAGSDSYALTFTGGVEDIGSEIFNLTSDHALTYDNGETGTWKTYSLTDGADIVFAGLVSEDGTNYKGDTADYQMILPEDGTAQDATATEYNLWIELQ